MPKLLSDRLFPGRDYPDLVHSKPVRHNFMRELGTFEGLSFGSNRTTKALSYILHSPVENKCLHCSIGNSPGL